MFCCVFFFFYGFLFFVEWSSSNNCIIPKWNNGKQHHGNNICFKCLYFNILIWLMMKKKLIHTNFPHTKKWHFPELFSTNLEIGWLFLCYFCILVLNLTNKATKNTDIWNKVIQYKLSNINQVSNNDIMNRNKQKWHHFSNSIHRNTLHLLNSS